MLPAWLRELSERGHRETLTSSRSSWAQAHTHERVAERQLVVAKTNPPIDRQWAQRCLACWWSFIAKMNLPRAHNKVKFIFISFNFIVWFLEFVPVSGVSPDARGWSLYLTQLGGFVSRQRWFSSKRRKLGYSRHYIAVFTHLKVRATLFWRENFIFFRKKYF
jgi:hypothetical protein